MAMRLGYVRDENGKLVRKFVEEGQKNNPDILYHVGATFGDYTCVEEERIEEAKAELLDRMLDAIRELAKNDKFWIVKDLDYWKEFCHPDNMVDPVPKAIREGKISIAWKINFPHIEGYYNWEDADRLEKQLDSCFGR